MRVTQVLKYLAGYTIPLSAGLSFYFLGIYSFLTPVYAFGLLPFIELIIPVNNKNLSAVEEEMAKKDPVYDWLLYLHVPIQYGMLIWFLFIVTNVPLQGFELIGVILSMGTCCGVIGINVAHELGHRKNPGEQLLAKALLLTSLYMHFIIEHNKGHHKNVSTPNDPSSARLNEPLYLFYFRTITGTVRSAWEIQLQELTAQKKSFFSFSNNMFYFQCIQLTLLLAITFIFSFQTMLYFLLAASIGILLLEAVNYIEHYGLRREKAASGMYERVQPWHSWNSDHVIGRVVLYELTRHSDHHYMASRKYQVLRHADEAPQLPAGYPAMILLALIPPAYFRVMNPMIKKIQTQLK
jgi:alkane 1-monooxygenase